LDYIGLAFDEKVGDMVMHAEIPELSRYSIPRQLQDFKPFGQSGSQEDVRSLMAVKRGGWLFYAFEYECGEHAEEFADGIIGGHGHESSIRLIFAVVAADVLVDLPLLVIEPATAMSKLAQHFGLGQMKLESVEFNQRYCIHCTEQARVSQLLNPQAMEVILNARPMSWQMGGRHIVLHEPGGESAEFSAGAVDALMAFAACIPGFVQEDHFASRPTV
jgi:hypothetical protein